ncbi:MFS transporter [Tessaracoccus flavus]|uniref:Uncharacterized protein n=1 Tax=Tessaracoccus flavus TaxID=1610493 RepID=A0A1Q2CI89_9ACTN|nr:MFS transporter [Tessaracoccus flavus]AQP45831.1 hypothetical protein RPIT_14295 [Tessaracoccus flavus]SDZ14981.1 Predicted arabinose efflux permease, MFS family [Tessaracoccus flavus]
MTTSESVYTALVHRSSAADESIAEEDRSTVARNGLRIVGASALQASGDQATKASTVLPWLLHALGAPAALIGLLVPIRESGSMLPQAFLTPIVMRYRQRKWVVVVGHAVQAASVAVMTLIAAVGSGLWAGVGIVGALAVFSLGRCLTSIASKDVLGRTLPKGERGQVNGLATTASGIVAITLGLGLRLLGGQQLEATQLAWVLGGAAALWVLAAVLYAQVEEPDDDASADGESDGSWAALRLLRDDRDFRRFVTTRSFLLVSALAPPFIVSMSASSGADAVVGLGGFVVASGVASIIGGRLFGRMADRSSRRLMAFGAAASAAVVLLIVGIVALPGFSGETTVGTLVLVVGYFLLTLLHTGVRVGRKTYIVDMAEGDQRTLYVAVSNTAMGIILLVVGAISSAIALLGTVWALVFLAALGALGAVWGWRLPEVSQGS